MRSPFLLFPDDRLTVAELWGARLDGHVVEIGEGFMPADAVETAWLRAASLTPVLGTVLAATHLSAAWVHGACHEPPARHAVQRASTRRLHHVIGRRIVYRDPAIPPHDVVRIAGVLVTTPARTLADLVRTPDADGHRAAREWAAAEPDLVPRAVAWFEGMRVPHKRAALALLASLGQVTTT